MALIYPIPSKKRLIDSFFLKHHFPLPIKCPVCGALSYVLNIQDNLRESCICKCCGSNNRQRQIAHVTCQLFSNSQQKIKNLVELIKKKKKLKIYNTEASGPLHCFLRRNRNYFCSEYLGEDKKSGIMEKGIMHQDLQSTSFSENSFDLIISSEVFEHIPNPYKAFREIYRILKKGGCHIFTVPFYQESFLDEKRAILKDGKTIHLKEPSYHGDPLNSKDGILVYQIFSLEMLIELSKIGFRVRMHKIYKPFLGILGDNGIVFETSKE